MSPNEKSEPSASDTEKDGAGKGSKMPELPPRTRILLLILGWVVIIVGVACLILPGPGILIIAVGAALLSLVSVMIFKWLRYVMRPWPRGWRAMLRMRRKAYQRILRLTGGQG